MKLLIKRGTTSNLFRVKILDSAATDGTGKTGLAFGDSGMIISTIANNEATATAYTSAASNTETIATLGTFAAPSAGKARFKEVDATNHPGLYEIQLLDARFAVANSKYLYITISGVTGMAETDVEIQLDVLDDSDVNAQCDTALSDYDGPTNAEMNTQFADLNDLSAANMLTQQLVESYAAQGVVPTLAQILLEIRSFVYERAKVGTTVTTKKIDGSTTATTNTLDDATNPTSTTRAT